MNRTLICSGCGNLFEASAYQVRNHNKGNSAYCGTVCISANSSKTMANTNRKYASTRMKKHNPMYDPAIREKVTAKLRRLKRKPSVRGGNGTGLTAAEKVLSIATGLQPYTINTQGGRSKGYPTHYKLDLADPVRKLAIEVDGRSHNALSRQEQDRKKERFLNGIGWVILRFTNRQALEETKMCVERIEKGE